MSFIYAPHGWLLYAIPSMNEGAVIAGDVMGFELSAEHGYGDAAWRVTAEMAPGAQLHTKAPGGSAPGLESLMWEALQSWPESGRKGGRRWPPEMLALLALARNHPEEYEQLREGEIVLKALDA
jgi:hypothetical protein